MRKIFFLLLLSGAFAAQAGTVKLHGDIKHPIADSVTVTYDKLSISWEPQTYGTKLQPDGTFSFEFPVPDGFTPITITHGQQQTEIFVAPGADLAMTLDAGNFDSTLRYSGKGSDVANFMAKHVLENNMMGMFGMQAQMIAGKEPKDFETSLNGLRDKELSFLQANGNNLPQAFKDYYAAYYQYKVYSAMEIYPRVHEMYKQHSNKITNVPKEDFVVTDDIPLAFEDKYITMPAYQEYLFNLAAVKYDARQAEAGHIVEQITPIDSLLNFIYSVMPAATAEFAAGRTMFVYSKYTSLEQLEQAYSNYKKRYSHSQYLEALEGAVAAKKKLAGGKQAPDFNIVTADGSNLKLSDLRGKVVYIDFWSKSCVPCIAEMPDAKKVREHFKDKPVAFVYISMDDDADVWRKAMQQYEVNGINMHVDKGWESDVVKQYDVKGIPSHFLVDKNGNFALPTDEVARPGDQNKLIAQIEELLK